MDRDSVLDEKLSEGLHAVSVPPGDIPWSPLHDFLPQCAFDFILQVAHVGFLRKHVFQRCRLQNGNEEIPNFFIIQILQATKITALKTWFTPFFQDIFENCLKYSHEYFKDFLRNTQSKYHRQN